VGEEAPSLPETGSVCVIPRDSPRALRRRGWGRGGGGRIVGGGDDEERGSK